MKNKPDENEPSIWVTAIKLVVGLTVIIGGVGLVLFYAKDMDNGYAKSSGADQWGVAKDSPMRVKR